MFIYRYYEYRNLFTLERQVLKSLVLSHVVKTCYIIPTHNIDETVSNDLSVVLPKYIYTIAIAWMRNVSEQ